MLALTGVVLAVVLVGCGGSDEPSGTTQTTTTVAEAATSQPEDGTDGDDGSTSLPAGGAGPLFEAACAGELSVRAVATMPDHLTSVSGLAASRRHPGVLWAIEDSFEPAVVTALDPDGRVLAEVTVRSGLFPNVDWEDLAISTGPDGTPWIHVADIGDNLGIRRDLRLFRFPEPELSDATVEAEEVGLRHEEGRPNAEALVVDDEGGIWVIDKDPSRPARILRADDDGVLVQVGTADLGGEQVTAADLSADGGVLALRTVEQLRLYRVPDGGDVAAALASEPCVTPAPPERQGESVALLGDGSALVTVSEDESGEPVELHRTAP